MEIFRRRLKYAREAADMNPSPPISIISRITACPKLLHWVQVSVSTSPVTQVADVAVNRDTSGPAERPLREAAGRFSSAAPARMIPRNVNAVSLLILNAWRTFLVFREAFIIFPSSFPGFPPRGGRMPSPGAAAPVQTRAARFIRLRSPGRSVPPRFSFPVRKRNFV